MSWLDRRIGDPWSSFSNHFYACLPSRDKKRLTSPQLTQSFRHLLFFLSSGTFPNASLVKTWRHVILPSYQSLSECLCVVDAIQRWLMTASLFDDLTHILLLTPTQVMVKERISVTCSKQHRSFVASGRTTIVEFFCLGEKRKLLLRPAIVSWDFSWISKFPIGLPWLFFFAVEDFSFSRKINSWCKTKPVIQPFNLQFSTMVSLCECRLFNRPFAFDELSKNPAKKKIKFTRAFQFLQLLLIQRVYRLDLITCSAIRRSLKYQQQQQNYQVFLGGSCNPTTWRHDQAIPYFQSRSVSFYNPQVADWTPDLVEIEHRAKKLAPLLFFVIDHDTRALASIVEVCYLAARGRSIIVVMNSMPDKNSTKFIQHKSGNDTKDDEGDYENACEARQTLRHLLRTVHIPVFDNVRLALDCAAYILETTKRTVAHNCAINEEIDGEQGNRDWMMSDRKQLPLFFSLDVVSPLPSSLTDGRDLRSSSVVFIRSISNKTAFDTPDEFYRQMRQSEMTPSSPGVVLSRYNGVVSSSSRVDSLVQWH